MNYRIFVNNILLFLGILILSLKATLAQPTAYYPLSKGNYWEYQYGFYRESISDSFLINGNFYSILETKYNDGSILEIKSQRQVGDSVFVYNNLLNQEHLLYNFSAQTGDTIFRHVDGSDTMDIILVEKSMANLFGKNLRRWKYFIDYSRLIIDDEESRTVTDSIGLTAYWDFWLNFSIIGAIIDSTQYGQVTHIETTNIIRPNSIYLFQNNPNPFNPATTINFQLSSSRDIELAVYNHLGQKVKILINERMMEGNHHVQWDGTDEENKNVASGFYLYQLRAGREFRVRKMLLLR